MTNDNAFHVAFLTNFSDTCFRAIPAVAQLCDEFDVRLTIVHTYGPDARGLHAVDATLHSFFPEAERYGDCRRLAIAGTPVDAVRQLVAAGRLDLIVAPAGDPLGLPRLTRHSIRARLVREAVAPVWTVGPGASAAVLGRAHRNVACIVRVGSSDWEHVHRACEYAKALGATLHVVHVLPDVHDGTMLRLAFAAPFDASSTAARVRAVTGSGSMSVQLHVTHGPRLAELLEQTRADIVFVDGTHWIGRRWLARRVSRSLDTLKRPVVCGGSTDGEPWPLVRRRHTRTRRWSAAMLVGDPLAPVRVPVRSGPTLVARA